MKKFWTLIFMTAAVVLQAQQPEFVNARKIKLNGEKLSKIEVLDLMEGRPEAQKMYKSGKSFKSTGDVLLFGGLGVITAGVLLDTYGGVGKKSHKIRMYPGQNYNTKYDDDSTLSVVSLIVGGSMIITSIPLKIIGHKRVRNSVDLYNRDSDAFNQAESTPAVFLVSSGNGLGLSFKF